jgi:hypothetical protein
MFYWMLNETGHSTYSRSKSSTPNPNPRQTAHEKYLGDMEEDDLIMFIVEHLKDH